MEIGPDGLTIAYMSGVEDMKKEYKSRKCKSCKWYKEEYNEHGWEEHNVFVCNLYDIAHGKDFGCNKWEKK